MLFLYDPECELCCKIKKWLDSKEIQYEERNIVTDRPSAEEILQWTDQGKYPMKGLWNMEKRGLKIIRLMHSMAFMPRETQAYVLLSDPDFLRHPILVGDNFLIAGTNKPEWNKTLNIKG